MKLEEQILEPWQDANFRDHNEIDVYNCRLKVQIGNHSPGTKFAIVRFDYNNSLISLHNNVGSEEIVEIHDLVLSISPRTK